MAVFRPIASREILCKYCRGLTTCAADPGCNAAKILELGIETLKIESGACDLPPEGSKKKSCSPIHERGLKQLDLGMRIDVN